MNERLRYNIIMRINNGKTYECGICGVTIEINSREEISKKRAYSRIEVSSRT